MKIYSYEKDKILHCRFRGHEFEIYKDDSGCSSNWYMDVRNDAGEICCDGWINDSSRFTVQEAMIAACQGAMLDLPKRWPIFNAELGVMPDDK